MTEATIDCPKCITEIKLTESLAAPIVEATRKQYESQMARKDTDIAACEKAIRAKEQQESGIGFDLSYLMDKSEQVLLAINEALKIVRNPDLSARKSEDALCFLSNAIHDLSKVFACLSGTEWSPDDADLILDYGDEGLEDFRAKHGLMDITRTARHKRLTAAKELLERSQLEEPLGRQQCYDIVYTAPKERPFQELADLLEDVQMRNKPWSEFQHAAMELLPDVVKNEGRRKITVLSLALSSVLS